MSTYLWYWLVVHENQQHTDSLLDYLVKPLQCYEIWEFGVSRFETTEVYTLNNRLYMYTHVIPILCFYCEKLSQSLKFLCFWVKPKSFVQLTMQQTKVCYKPLPYKCYIFMVVVHATVSQWQIANQHFLYMKYHYEMDDSDRYIEIGKKDSCMARETPGQDGCCLTCSLNSI